MDINFTASTCATPFIDELSNNQQSSISNKLKIIHKEIKRHMTFVDRIAIIVYEQEHDLLKTFIYSDDVQEKILQFYQSKLSDSKALCEIALTGDARIINDQGIFDRPVKTHSRFIAKRNYGASYTSAFYNNEQFAGLIFINSRDKNVFDEASCSALAPFVLLIGQLVCEEINRLNTLYGSVTTALHQDYEATEMMAG